VLWLPVHFLPARRGKASQCSSCGRGGLYFGVLALISFPLILTVENQPGSFNADHSTNGTCDMSILEYSKIINNFKISAFGVIHSFDKYSLRTH
jgi:hypothetical protein